MKLKKIENKIVCIKAELKTLAAQQKAMSGMATSMKIYSETITKSTLQLMKQSFSEDFKFEDLYDGFLVLI